MAKFHSLAVAEVTRETPDCVSLSFHIPEELKNEYSYRQGQYVTLKLNIGGEEVRRSYSLCSSPVTETEFRIAVKKVKNGKGSGFLNEKAKAGDRIEVMTPMGNFHSPMSSSHKKHYVLFAGGSGITPVFSILKTVLHSEPLSSITLFYANLDEGSIIFRNKIKEIASKNSDRVKVHFILENPPAGTDALHTGIMTKEKIKQFLAAFVPASGENEYFICGPKPMMDNAREVLEEFKTEKSRIHIEYFTASADVAGGNVQPVGEKIHSRVTVIQYGIETVMELNSDGKVILEAALDAGVDVPFACKGGVCCTCRAKVMKGKVRMEKNFALTDSEVDNGYVLTCQSHPITDEVVVDYDQY